MPAGRRDFLRGAAVTAVGAAAFAGVTVATQASAASPSGRVIEFAGPHQAGILTPQQQAASFISFDVVSDRRVICASCCGPSPAGSGS